MPGDLEIQIVAKQFQELQAHSPALRQQSPTLPQIVAKVDPGSCGFTITIASPIRAPFLVPPT
jgi:hypothetical protein